MSGQWPRTVEPIVGVRQTTFRRALARAGCKGNRQEASVCRSGCHWAIFLGPATVLAVGLLLLNARPYDGMALTGFAFLWGILSQISRTRSVICLTGDRLCIHAGFPLPHSCELPLDRIDSVEFYQPALGSMFDFGKVVFSYERGKTCVVRFVSSPAAFAAEVRQKIESLRKPGAPECSQGGERDQTVAPALRDALFAQTGRCRRA